MKFLGIDIGTSSVKALVTNMNGEVVAAASEPYPLHRPHPGWTEQDPQDWWEATKRAVRALSLDADSIAGVGFSGQMHGLVLLDEAAADSRGRSDAVLRRALLWNDQRTAPQCERIERLLGGRAGAVRMVGNAPLTGFTLPKLLWVRDEEPETFARAAVFMMPKDYVRFRLTGQIATDVGDGSGTLLFDPAIRGWNFDAAAAAGISRSMLPPALESGDIAGRVTPYGASELGLREGTPVIAGSGDNMMGAIGAGIVSPGMAVITIGTSGVVYSHSDSLRLDLPASGPVGRVHSMCAATGRSHSPRGWCVTGCSLSSGGSLAWAKESVWPEATYETLYAEAGAVSPGSEGLIFLPYLTGERCPYPDPTARGAWVGLTARHGRGHMVRAILEGVACTLATIVRIQRDAGVRINRLRLGGGGARSSLWRGILADAVGEDLAMPNTEEGPAFGAALLAQSTVEGRESIAALCERAVRETLVVNPEHRGVYDGAMRMQHETYGALRAQFERMS